MAYRVVYAPVPPVVKYRKCSQQRLQTLTAAFLLAFALTVRQVWPEGREILRQYLIPGEPTVTEQAFRDLMTDLQQGQPIGDAVTAFCEQIVENGVPEVY